MLTEIPVKDWIGCAARPSSLSALVGAIVPGQLRKLETVFEVVGLQVLGGASVKADTDQWLIDSCTKCKKAAPCEAESGSLHRRRDESDASCHGRKPVVTRCLAVDPPWGHIKAEPKGAGRKLQRDLRRCKMMKFLEQLQKKIRVLVVKLRFPDEDEIQEMMEAGLRRDISALEKLLQNAVHIDWISEYIFHVPACLTIAADTGDIESVELLLEARADLELCTAKGQKPKSVAAERHHFDRVRRLLEAEANINAADDAGDTALHVATEAGHLNIVRHLVERGAEKDRPNRDGETPLLIACHERHEPIVHYLVESGCNANQSDRLGQSPLWIAAFRLSHCALTCAAQQWISGKIYLTDSFEDEEK
eukprot:s4299_g2.t1